MFCFVFYALNANCCLYVVMLRPQTSIVVQLCPYVDNFDGFIVFLLSVFGFGSVGSCSDRGSVLMLRPFRLSFHTLQLIQAESITFV